MKSSKKMGRIVSQALQPGKSVCVVCGRPVDHDVSCMGKKAFIRYVALCMNYTVLRETFVREGRCVPCDYLRVYKLGPLLVKTLEEIQADR